MTLSMTGFALYREDTSQGELVWEIRSVNQRFLDLTVRLPEECRVLEEGVRKQLKSRISRGKVECNLKFKASPSQSLSVNQHAVEALMKACEEVVPMMPHAQAFTALDVLRWPGILATEQSSAKALHQIALAGLDEAIILFIASRQREGDALAETIKKRCQSLDQLVAQAREAVPIAVAALKQKIIDRIDEVTAAVDQDRLEQELVYWFQKMDVDEELDRLDVHLKEVAAILQSDEPVGRRLDFIIQEMNREANTLGSKAANTPLTQIALEMKVLIEQIREQVQNVE